MQQKAVRLPVETSDVGHHFVLVVELHRKLESLQPVTEVKKGLGQEVRVLE